MRWSQRFFKTRQKWNKSRYNVTKKGTKMSQQDMIVWENALKDECSIPVCSRNVYATGLCNMHYQRNRTLANRGITAATNWVKWYEQMNKNARKSRRNASGTMYKCSVAGCNNDVRAKGLCLKHYMYERRKY